MGWLINRNLEVSGDLAVKDLALLLLWCAFDSWPQTICTLWVELKKNPIYTTLRIHRKIILISKLKFKVQKYVNNAVKFC